MKPNGTFVVAPCQKAEVMPIVKEEAEKQNNCVVEASMNAIQLLHTDLNGTDFCIMAVHYTCVDWRTSVFQCLYGVSCYKNN
ncbi:MAG: hypothetical protein ACLSCV_05350 [Acutalibacteraceae bacterium]